MKRNTFASTIALLVVSFFLAGNVFAQGMMGYPQNTNLPTQSTSSINLNTAVDEILKAQNVASISQLNCTKITDSQFEKLGDAYMGYGISEQQHTAMEQMMGGEGSSSLTQAHIAMGRSYLGCWNNYASAPYVMPMMGYAGPSGYYSQPDYFPGTMMGGNYGGYAWGGMVTMTLVWALLIMGIIYLAATLFKNKK